jgi:hypothetical protein
MWIPHRAPNGGVTQGNQSLPPAFLFSGDQATSGINCLVAPAGQLGVIGARWSCCAQWRPTWARSSRRWANSLSSASSCALDEWKGQDFRNRENGELSQQGPRICVRHGRMSRARDKFALRLIASSTWETAVFGHQSPGLRLGGRPGKSRFNCPGTGSGMAGYRRIRTGTGPLQNETRTLDRGRRHTQKVRGALLPGEIVKGVPHLRLRKAHPGSYFRHRYAILLRVPQQVHRLEG